MGCCEGELLEKWCGDSGNNESMKKCGGNELLKKESGDDVQMTNELLNMVMMSSEGYSG